jgi:hypothetical protein
MSSKLLEPVELRAKGFETLARALGWVNAVRFIQQYEPSKLNYTAERDSLLPGWDASEMVRRMGEVQGGTSAKRP